MPVTQPIGPLLTDGDGMPGGTITVNNNICTSSAFGSAACSLDPATGEFSVTLNQPDGSTVELSGTFLSNVLLLNGSWEQTRAGETSPFVNGTWMAHLGGSGGLKVNGSAAGGYTFDGNGYGLNVTFNLGAGSSVAVPINPQTGAINSSGITGSFSSNTEGSGTLINSKRQDDSWEADSSR